MRKTFRSLSPRTTTSTRPATRAKAAAICAVVLGASSRPALAWGRVGHRASARLAYDRLTPAAKAAVRDLLEQDESFTEAATWADEHSRDIKGSAAWHYVNVPISARGYEPRYCPRSGCVISKIDEYRRILADRRAPRAERRQALRFLIHFIQDVHQPLHVGDRDDRGGNSLQVQFFGAGSNLHRVWDSGLFGHAHVREGVLVRELEASVTRDQAERWSGGTPVDWANESLDAAKRAYLDPRTKTPLRSGDSLGEAYQEAQYPVARQRLAQSGIRLASVLNEILK